MKITIITVGKIKEKYLNDGIAEYVKRLSRYCKLEILQVADEKTPDKASESIELQIKETEGDRILKLIKEDYHVIALDLAGKTYTSPEMASAIERLGVSGTGHLVFVIGGSLGLSQSVLKRANESWSFSKLTFPHQLMRMILLEQLYRSFRILQGAPYHK